MPLAAFCVANDPAAVEVDFSSAGPGPSPRASDAAASAEEKVTPRRTRRVVQPPSPLFEPAFERPQRPTELLGRLVPASAFQVAEHQGRTVPLGQPVQLLIQQEAAFPAA